MNTDYLQTQEIVAREGRWVNHLGHFGEEAWGEVENHWSAMEDHLADVVSSGGHNPSLATPLFYEIPRTGTTQMKTYMRSCAHVGSVKKFSESYPQTVDHLQDVRTPDSDHVSAHLQTHSSIERWSQSGIVEEDRTNVIMTMYPSHAAQIFSPEHPATLFFLMRHPVDRAASEFYLLQKNTQSLQGMTAEEYYLSGDTEHLHENNAVLRQLTGKTGTEEPVTKTDLRRAKDMLSRKALVGLTHRMEESALRFAVFFGWDHDSEFHDSCFEQLMSDKRNQIPHDFVNRTSDLYRVLAEHDQFDLFLYRHVQSMFEEQGKLLFHEDEDDEETQ